MSRVDQDEKRGFGQSRRSSRLPRSFPVDGGPPRETWPGLSLSLGADSDVDLTDVYAATLALSGKRQSGELAVKGPAEGEAA
jgi:hypothetical protein